MTRSIPKQQLTDTAETVLERRYYLKDAEGKPLENWETLCRRVSNAVAQVDLDQPDYEGLADRFFTMIYYLDFLPNSPCLMNAGTDLGQLSACFVLPVEDSMDGIFTSIRNGALVHKTGGGTGYSFSRLRPKNSAVQSTQGVASGPLSFAAVFDAATETIKQGGKRRGANMGVLRVDHPDILEFIVAKQDQTRYTNFNFSVAITDLFMEAVKNDQEYDLIDPSNGDIIRTLRAREVFDKIVDLAWHNGEPGVLFIDAANRDNTTPQLGKFEATNPCGEQWLLPYESCNLGSINLGQYVKNGKVDWERLGATARLAVRFLDNVIDCNRFPIPEIAEMTQKTRKVGLGIMGLHDMLIQLELPYGSEEGRQAAAEVMAFVRTEAEAASIELATMKGPFPAYDERFNTYPARRNAALTSIQPTGTVSMIADCASGCEPYFSIVMIKNVMDNDRLLMVNKLFERIARAEGFYSAELMEKVAKSGTVIGHAAIPKRWQEIFRTAQDISPEQHIRMQGVLQKNGVDSSISKTINLPSSATQDDVRTAYMLGFELGCKGLTVYRDGSRDHQVLNTVASSADKTAVAGSEGLVQKATLPDVLSAKRYRLKDINQETIYLIVCFDEDEKPMEVFAKFPFDNRVDLKDKSTMWTTTCRLVSLALRYQIPMDEIIKQLDRSSGHMLDLPAQLGKLLKSFMAATQHGFASICPECQGKLVFEEGCEVCRDCGYSKCS
ncbi:ribonucleoside-diphosphate reductase, adenosylcobalamin-dependent [Desulfobulbus propionicus DSM 2032]|jgi:ribonucleoside-diphosphate reductase alpha chain|uniref:Vitamin B12-dependent ribonucleotide reductase n=1 Tax=Desulfobulbus propionicus (strain ATCC 33891 / DSM 2032 / VKM B-1956 / 1pr3) TaxID=577650 RepID=A0A7U3YL97_DESPD|nr:adenosylcobalamin-dependent ribonucleoside-diphosphate reductase [Desulfobulbus propionicus]ADW17459.1 ribonucleoside-diphosphate reductase, adenosylcobalamin-dependent [Desulfobulbus propionicus DSM 2032]